MMRIAVSQTKSHVKALRGLLPRVDGFTGKAIEDDQQGEYRRSRVRLHWVQTRIPTKVIWPGRTGEPLPLSEGQMP